ncbi:MAG TPA: hypothetical protein VID72_01065, partial [Ktedonobacterales bacterium]
MTSASPPSSQFGQRTVYTGALLMAAAMAALVALLVIVLLTGPALTVALGDLAQGPSGALAHAQVLGMLIAGPALCAVLAALGMWRLIWVARVTRYMRYLRAYCEDRLRRDAPLLSMGLQPTGALLDVTAAADGAQAPRPIAELLAAQPQALLLGAVGAGKTTALLTVAQALSGRSITARVVFGVRHESLPALISLTGLARSLGSAPANPTPYIAELLARLGTEGLGARTEKLLRSGRITLLCDDYDKLDDDERDSINQALQTLREPPYSACRVVVACESASYATVVDDLGPLAQFSAIELAPIPIAELTHALRKRQTRRQRTQEKSGVAVGPLVGDMHDRPLGVSLPTAAVAAALTETLAAG